MYIRWGISYFKSLVQRPLQSQCRNYIEAVTTTEVIAQFHFRTDTQVKVFIHSLDAVQVYPELRFGEENGFSILGFFTPPVDKTGEGEQILAKVHVPCSCQLEVIRGWVLLYILIHSSQCEASGKRSIIIGIGGSRQISVVVGEFFCQSAIVFEMGGERTFPEFSSRAISQ